MDKVEKVKKIGNWIAAILLGNTRELIARIDERTEYILKDIEEMKPKVSDMSPKVDILWKERLAPGNSPSMLNERGQEILGKSGVKELIDNGFPQFFDAVKERNPQNAYQVQEFSREAVAILKNPPDVLSKLQEGAFQTGVDVDSVLFVGALYLRDLLLPKLNFTLRKLD